MYLEFMKKYLFLILASFIISSCTLNKVVKHHGVHFLEKKQSILTTNKTNKNDIIKLLGQSSTSSTFDEDLLIYIERNTSSSKLINLGKRTLLTNNVLILELDNKGILIKKKFLNKDDMKNINFSTDSINMDLLKKSFVYDFLTSVREKINNPLGYSTK